MDIPHSTEFERIVWDPRAAPAQAFIAGRPEDGIETAEREHEMELEQIQLSDHELYQRHQALLADELYEKEGDR